MTDHPYACSGTYLELLTMVLGMTCSKKHVEGVADPATAGDVD